MKTNERRISTQRINKAKRFSKVLSDKLTRKIKTLNDLEDNLRGLGKDPLNRFKEIQLSNEIDILKADITQLESKLEFGQSRLSGYLSKNTKLASRNSAGYKVTK